MPYYEKPVPRSFKEIARSVNQLLNYSVLTTNLQKLLPAMVRRHDGYVSFTYSLDLNGSGLAYVQSYPSFLS